MQTHIDINSKQDLTIAQDRSAPATHICQNCGCEDEFLMIFDAPQRESRWLCSSCYARSISTRLYQMN